MRYCLRQQSRINRLAQSLNVVNACLEDLAGLPTIAKRGISTAFLVDRRAQPRLTKMQKSTRELVVPSSVRAFYMATFTIPQPIPRHIKIGL